MSRSPERKKKVSKPIVVKSETEKIRYSEMPEQPKMQNNDEVVLDKNNRSELLSNQLEMKNKEDLSRIKRLKRLSKEMEKIKMNQTTDSFSSTNQLELRPASECTRAVQNIRPVSSQGRMNRNAEKKDLMNQ